MIEEQVNKKKSQKELRKEYLEELEQERLDGLEEMEESLREYNKIIEQENIQTILYREKLEQALEIIKKQKVKIEQLESKQNFNEENKIKEELKMTNSSQENQKINNKIEEEKKIELNEEYLNELEQTRKLSKEEHEIESLRNHNMFQGERIMSLEKQIKDLQWNTIQDILILSGNDKIYKLEKISEKECEIYRYCYDEYVDIPIVLVSGEIEEILKFLERIIKPNREKNEEEQQQEL